MSTAPSRVEVKRATAGAIVIPTRTPTFACMAGVCEMGPVGACNAAAGTPEADQPITSWPGFQRIYGGFTVNARDLPIAAKQYFDEGGQLLYVSRVVHTTTLGDPTTKTSAKATLEILTSSQPASSGRSQGVVSGSGTYALSPAQTLVLAIDAIGPVTATFNAAVAQRDSAAGPFALTNGMQLSLTIISTNGTVSRTITFATAQFVSIGAATATEVVAVLNADFSANNVGATALVVGGTVRIKTTRFGLGASVNITGGTANAVLLFTTGALAGTGNVQDIAFVTLAELETIVELATSNSVTVTSPGGVPTITSVTTGGTSIVQITGASTATAFGFDNAAHAGGAAGTEPTLQLDGLWDGTYAHAFTMVVAAAASGDTDVRDFTLKRDGIAVESWRDASMDPLDPDYIVTLINVGGGSKNQKASIYVMATDLEASFPAPGNLPATGTHGPLAGGDDGLSGLVDTDFGGAKSVAGATGLRVFNTIARIDEAALPGRATASAQAQLVTWCEIDREGRTFFILGSPAGASAAAVRTHVVTTAGLKGLSEIGMIAWPRMLVDNPSTTIYGSAKTLVQSPEGALMGLHARVDRSKQGGAFEHPSNALGQLFTGRGLETLEGEDPTTRGLCQNDLIVTLRSAGGSVSVDGARTLKATGPFPTVGESRGVMLVQNELIAAFEILRNANIRPRLYGTLTSSATVYLRALTDAECFRTKVYEDAFYVNFTPALNTPAVQDAREVLGEIGLNTSPPAELISITIVPFRGLEQQFLQAA